jgi:hypothetical protein
MESNINNDMNMNNTVEEELNNTVDENLNNVEGVTTVAVLLDNSGSMESMGPERIQALRSLYDEQKKSGVFRSTLAIFSNTMSYIHQDVLSSDLKEIEDFKPDGMTALYDSLVEVTLPFITAGTKNGILVIITDGLENASYKNNSTVVKTQIGILEKMGWKIVYLGANQDSFTTGRNIGATLSCDYEATPRGFTNLVSAVSDGLRRQISGEGRFEMPKLVRTDAHAGAIPITEEEATDFEDLIPPEYNTPSPSPLIATFSHM